MQAKGLSRVFSNTTVQKHQFFGTQLSLWSTLTYVYDYWRTIVLIIWTIVSKLMSLLFNTLSGFVIAFIPRSKHLLISWLQSLSAVILEPKNIKSATFSPFTTFLVAQMVKNLPAMQETWVQSLGWEDALEKGITIHSSILAWRIPRTEEPGRVQFTGLQRVGHE